jgi:putative pyruvate formate lyase activating enzyme
MNSSLVSTESELAEIIDRHTQCCNVNFVGGEPTPYLPFILRVLQEMRSELPVVWNSNFYMSESSMALLKGVVDVYLSDFKYGNDDCAMRLSDVPNYTEIVKRNHRLTFEDSELVVRHLILPGHIECCTRPILQFLSENFGDRVIVNLMDQYRPCYRANEHADLDRRISTTEKSSAIDCAQELGLNYMT